ncbi:MAG TPA: DegT/DnrJ/EryC1/StrS family aminotransferase [Polyangiaceae bacterium LLY-WYZ-14_1]|nr:DegT/DnrJ/EryC1/StrS family aminotransferase [Polyangiaceae bacterium LLY-WYZ-14_1]
MTNAPPSRPSAQIDGPAPATEPVPLLDLAAHHAPILPEIREAIDRVLGSSRFIMGPEVERLEAGLAELVGVPHAIGVSSGTDALLVSLMALDVGPGDEVVTTPFSFFATAGVIHRLGATPVFVDIDPVTFNLDPAGLDEAISDRTKAILPVHLFGQVAAMDQIQQTACRHGLPILEDAAQAIGATSPWGPAGRLGLVAAFSFFPTKNLGAVGDGGIVTTPDDALADRIRRLRVHGARPKYFHAMVGGNFRLDALQAAVLNVKLPRLPAWTAARQRNAARYDALFAEAVLPPGRLTTPTRVVEGHVYNQYTIRTDRRDALREHLAERKIGTEIYYPKPLHRQACFAHLGYPPGSLPEAERAADEVLSLPIYPELTEAQQRTVVDAVVDFLRRAD